MIFFFGYRVIPDRTATPSAVELEVTRNLDFSRSLPSVRNDHNVFQCHSDRVPIARDDEESQYMNKDFSQVFEMTNTVNSYRN